MLRLGCPYWGSSRTDSARGSAGGSQPGDGRALYAKTRFSTHDRCPDEHVPAPQPDPDGSGKQLVKGAEKIGFEPPGLHNAEMLRIRQFAFGRQMPLSE